jgi:hypothetical protein
MSLQFGALALTLFLKLYPKYHPLCLENEEEEYQQADE